MDEGRRSHDDRALRVQLDLHLDREPICGRLRTEGGADERFVGWLGFVDALKRLQEREGGPRPPITRGDREGDGDDG